MSHSSISPTLRSKWIPLLAWFFTGFLLISAIATIPWEPATAAVNQATVMEILDGNQVYIQDRPAKKQDIARRQQQIRTGASRTELRFDNGAVGRLGKNSQLIVGSQCFQVQRGQILVNGAVDGCTKSRRLSVRGTTYLVDVDEEEQTQITVLEGEVAVTPVTTTEIDADVDSTPRPQPMPESSADEVVITAGQRIAITPQGVLGQVIPLSRQEFERLLLGELFNGFSQQIPGINKVRSAFQGLYPGVPFPTPRIPRPSLPIRLPF